MFSSIPDELQINIVERLPVKNIIRFTAVNKTWYSTIKIPGLLNPHINLSKSLVTNSELDESCILFIPRELTNGCENCCFLLSQDSLVCHETLKFKFTGNKYVTIVGSSVNGVICLARDEGAFGKELFLFNPSIRVLRPIPSSFLEDQLEKSSHRVGRSVGFGYYETSDDYKVLRHYDIYKRRVGDSARDNQGIFEDDAKLEAEVYSLRSNYWKKVETIHHDYTSGSVSLNNASYWLCMTENESRMMIIAFDFSAEVFRKIPPPLDSEIEFTYLLTYKGSLAILVVDEEDIEDELEEEEGDESEEVEEKATVTLWILKYDGEEESWSEEFTRVIPRSCYEPVEFTKTGKLIFWKTDSDLALWDPETRQVVDLDEFYDSECIIVKDYVESLVLL